MTKVFEKPLQPKLRIPMLIVGSQLFYERAFPAALKEHFELFYFDHNGFVENQELFKSAYSDLDSIVADIEAFRLRQGLEKFLLFGHSGHAYMALEYSKTFSERILGLILCGCSPDLSPESHQAAESYFSEMADQFRKRILEQDMAVLGDKIQAEPSLRFVHFVLCQKAKNWFDPTYDASWLWHGVPTHLPTLDFVWGTIFGQYQADLNLERVNFPVLFLQGKYDFVAGPHSRWESITSKISKVSEIIFEKSGHYPMVEQSEDFLNEIDSWTSKLNQVSN